MRIHSLCKILRKMDILQEVLSLAHKRPEIKSPNFSKVKVIDIFHRLGPLSIFSAKNKWHPIRTVLLVRGANGFGFTLRGDSPVLVAGIIAGGCAAVDKKMTAMTSGGAGTVLKSNKENNRKTPLPSKAGGGLLAWGRKSKRSKSCSSMTHPFAVGDNTLAH
ncbi:Rhophilin-1, partial [Ophiophagus hannah]